MFISKFRVKINEITCIRLLQTDDVISADDDSDHDEWKPWLREGIKRDRIEPHSDIPLFPAF